MVNYILRWKSSWIFARHNLVETHLIQGIFMPRWTTGIINQRFQHYWNMIICYLYIMHCGGSPIAFLICTKNTWYIIIPWSFILSFITFVALKTNTFFLFLILFYVQLYPAEVAILELFLIKITLLLSYLPYYS